MAILENIRNDTPYILYADGSPEGPFSNRGSAIAGIILRFEISNLKKKSIFGQKLYENSLKISGHF